MFHGLGGIVVQSASVRHCVDGVYSTAVFLFAAASTSNLSTNYCGNAAIYADAGGRREHATRQALSSVHRGTSAAIRAKGRERRHLNHLHYSAQLSSSTACPMRPLMDIDQETRPGDPLTAIGQITSSGDGSCAGVVVGNILSTRRDSLAMLTPGTVAAAAWSPLRARVAALPPHPPGMRRQLTSAGAASTRSSKRKPMPAQRSAERAGGHLRAAEQPSNVFRAVAGAAGRAHPGAHRDRARAPGDLHDDARGAAARGLHA